MTDQQYADLKIQLDRIERLVTPKPFNATKFKKMALTGLGPNPKVFSPKYQQKDDDNQEQ